MFPKAVVTYFLRRLWRVSCLGGRVRYWIDQIPHCICTVLQFRITHTLATYQVVSCLRAVCILAYSLCLGTCCLHADYTCSQQEQLFHNLLLIMMMIPTTTMITIYVARNTDLRYLRVLRTSEHCSFDISVVTGECRNCTIYEFAFDNWILGFLWNVDQ